MADSESVAAEYYIPGIVETVAVGRNQHRRTEDSLVVHHTVAAGSRLVGTPRIGSGCILHTAGIAVVHIAGTAEIGVGMTGRPAGSELHLAGMWALFVGFRGLGFAAPAGRGGHPERLCRLRKNCQYGVRRNGCVVKRSIPSHELRSDMVIDLL